MQVDCVLLWSHQILDEHQNVFLLKSSFDASLMEDSERRAHVLQCAHRRLEACSINFVHVATKASLLSKKPLLVDIQVTRRVFAAFTTLCIC